MDNKELKKFALRRLTEMKHDINIKGKLFNDIIDNDPEEAEEFEENYNQNKEILLKQLLFIIDEFGREHFKMMMKEVSKDLEIKEELLLNIIDIN